MNETTDATAILAPLWRRKWLILAVAIIVAGASYAYYKRQPKKYRSTTDVYLAAGAEQQLSEKGIGKSFSTNAGSQSALINSLIIGEVKAKLKREKGDKIAKQAAKGKAKAKTAEKSEFVAITGEARTGKASALLVNRIATAYIARQRANARHGLETSLAIARRQLKRISKPTSKTTKNGQTTVSASSVIQQANLTTKINQFESQLAVRTVEQVKPALPKVAELLSPKPRKSAIFGFVIGLVLASIAAFALSRFNRRLRSLSDIEAVLDAQILTALPLVRRPIVRRAVDGGSAKVPTPSRNLLEPLRRFHTTLRLGTGRQGEDEVQPRTILFLSADPGDGKSTVVADLALVQREGGERTAVVEADFRRPMLARMLDVSGPLGLSNVLSGAATLDQAMQVVPGAHPAPVAVGASAAVGADVAGGGLATTVSTNGSGSISALIGDRSVTNPPLVLASAAMSEVLRSAADDYSFVLVDAPAPLEVSDVMPLLDAVDAIVLVARVGHTREATAQRLRQLLERTPRAPILGVIANGASVRDMRRFGISTGVDGQGWLAKLLRR
jgi:Mrp family chromosome partitioning ATPase